VVWSWRSVRFGDHLSWTVLRQPPVRGTTSPGFRPRAFSPGRISFIRLPAGAAASILLLAGCSSYGTTGVSADGAVPAPSSSDQWNQYGGDPQNSGRSSTQGPQPLQTVSVSRVSHEAASPCGWDAVMTSVAVDGHGNLYFGTSGGHVVSLSPAHLLTGNGGVSSCLTRTNATTASPETMTSTLLAVCLTSISTRRRRSPGRSFSLGRRATRMHIVSMRWIFSPVPGSG
jgi:hypothetical protein